jgi:hypothetical protein
MDSKYPGDYPYPTHSLEVPFRRLATLFPDYLTYTKDPISYPRIT